MKKEKLGSEPAFGNISQSSEKEYPGMSKRFYAACAAMQGLLAQAHDEHPQTQDMGVWNYECIAKCAFKAADELLTQENE